MRSLHCSGTFESLPYVWDRFKNHQDEHTMYIASGLALVEHFEPDYVISEYSTVLSHSFSLVDINNGVLVSS